MANDRSQRIRDLVSREKFDFRDAVQRGRKDQQQAILSERAARLRELVSKAKRREDPRADAAKDLLVEVAWHMLDGANFDRLPYEMREYMHRALIAAANKPKSADSALGLVRAKKRPPDPAFQIRNIEIAFEIRRLMSEGKPLKGGTRGRGAAELAAAKHHVSEGTGMAAWKKWGKWLPTE